MVPGPWAQVPYEFIRFRISSEFILNDPGGCRPTDTPISKIRSKISFRKSAKVQSGDVKIRIDQSHALDDTRAAHDALEARKTTGSTILTV